MIPTMISSPRPTKIPELARLRVGLVVPHIFMQDKLLPKVIFSPGSLALGLAAGLPGQDIDVHLFTPGAVTTTVPTSTADLSYFEQELAARDDDYLDLLKKHPLTFVSLARQVQAELIARAYAMANNNELDVVHIYTNEEDIALPFAALCTKPVVLTHHDPFNFLIAYKSVFPKHRALNWISISYAQRADMPEDTNWVGNVYHGLDAAIFSPNYAGDSPYVAYLGRIIEPKGVHLAIAAVKQYNRSHQRQLCLKIAGKHYAGHTKDSYWQKRILPEIDGKEIEYIGFLDGQAKADFLRGARALIMPSTFAEPFGMVAIEALACATPVIGLDSGALPEIIKEGTTGYVVAKQQLPDGTLDEHATAEALAVSLEDTVRIDRHVCRQDFEKRFTLERMCAGYADVYRTVGLYNGV
jgi:glycosyltransferase involved in cell wall biosynthesis